MNQGQLIDVAAAIADGMPIDWAAFASSTPPSPDLALPARIVERIAQVHASLPSVDSFASSLHKSLTGVCLPGDAAAPPEVPVTWGTLTIDEKIGRGTFGDVYRAHDRRLNRTVALKLLRRKDRLESAVIEEGQLMARVRHPNVVTVYGASGSRRASACGCNSWTARRSRTKRRRVARSRRMRSQKQAFSWPRRLRPFIAPGCCTET